MQVRCEAVMEIRPYCESDEAAVAVLWREVFPDSPSWNQPEADMRRKLSVQREFDLCSKAPVIRTRSVLSPINGVWGNPGREVVMPICIESPDKPRDRAQSTEDRGLSAPLADDPEACYTGRKPKFRMLSGSIQLLLYAKSRT